MLKQEGGFPLIKKGGGLSSLSNIHSPKLGPTKSPELKSPREFGLSASSTNGIGFLSPRSRGANSPYPIPIETAEGIEIVALQTPKNSVISECVAFLERLGYRVQSPSHQGSGHKGSKSLSADGGLYTRTKESSNIAHTCTAENHGKNSRGKKLNSSTSPNKDAIPKEAEKAPVQNHFSKFLATEKVSYLLFSSMVDQLTKEKEQCEQRIEQQVQQIHDLETRLVEKDEKIWIATAKYDALEKRCKQLQDQLKDTSKEIQDLQQKTHTLEKELQDEQKKASALHKHSQNMEARIDESAVENSTLLMVNKACNEKLIKARKELEDMSQKLKDVQAEAAAHREGYEHQLQEQANINAQQKQAIEAANAEIDELLKTQEALETKIAKYKRQIIFLSSKLSQREARSKAKQKSKLTKSPNVEAPKGQVTMVFTDVQGSTEQWELNSECMTLALDMHNNILRDKLKSTGGYEVKTEVQEALLVADWPEKLLISKHSAEEFHEGRLLFRGLRVRMGVHIGRPQCQLDPVTKRMDYFGQMVNRTSRIANIAHGGQVLISSFLYKDVENELTGVSVKHLGEFWLKGLKVKESVYQILPITLAHRSFPPIRVERWNAEDEDEVAGEEDA